MRANDLKEVNLENNVVIRVEKRGKTVKLLESIQI